MSLVGKRSAASTITLLDKGCEFDGKLSFEGVVRIDGTFRGEIFSHDHLIIGEGATVDATIHVGILEVGGSLKGTIVAKERVTIHSTGHLEGKVEAKELEVHRGGRFDGSMSMAHLKTQDSEVPAESIIHFRPKSAN